MIDKTGYWTKEWAIKHHVHSDELSKWICGFLKDFKNEITYDFGCGMGTYLNDLYNDGHQNIFGVEMDPPKTDYPFIIKSKNLTEPFNIGEKGNVISLEVGEHIPKQFQDIYLENLTSHCKKYLIISWALKGQGGYGHVNELNNDEIIPIIESKGFKYDEQNSLDARKNIEDNYWYFRNSVLVFEKV